MKISPLVRTIAGLALLFALLVGFVVPLLPATQWIGWVVVLGFVGGFGGWWWASRRQTAVRGGTAPETSLDAYVRSQATDWDKRTGAPDEAEGQPEDEAWRASLSEPPVFEEDEDGDDMGGSRVPSHTR